ncbi:hypothetical protein [Lysobacter sp. cf310]|uniref:hypothetical protein n=1 Tax=Lysobacter sp. cf310 TaxID=1761790 RepID=UPI0008ECD9D8|nr:hypothetical protein [Lysobacter sp. cf310]SFK43827.1 hypothetical protein SAMN04487938_0831 [Lysobacter sp. cf310]
MSLWSAQQREWLQALGHPALALASTAPEAPPPPRAEAPAAPERARAELRAPTAERAPERPVERAPTAAARADDALLRAVLRAAGRRPDAAPDEAVLSLYDAATLRGYPAAKRALWPLLRSLRRGSRP